MFLFAFLRRKMTKPHVTLKNEHVIHVDQKYLKNPEVVHMKQKV